ncbi:response regulator transcription factor [Mangrovivirga sp. M17]|uniref:Response regulator transcription factor n=1 Tax=Mangrovivirga halotolerans TaxID=2993936 RepID=A0ABT3RTM6_9BACT|nr:response regulator transcription factor [Mangrovivirga halotolerans]MCX2745130.1 response regulator transcription factor [Mangrovivirga halotolerans]
MQDPSIVISSKHTLLNLGLKSIISENFDTRIVIPKSLNELRKVLQNECSVLIIDFDNHYLPEISYVEKIKTEFNVPILVISSFNGSDNFFELLKYNLEGFISPECSANEIKESISSTSVGEKFYCKRVVNLIVSNQISTSSDPISKKEISTGLSPRELEVTIALAEGLSNSEIASKFYLSIHTVQTHRKNIMKKLGISSLAELVRYAFDNKLVNK